MKKFYVKPVATNIAFVVNENIATSRNPDTSLTGFGSYANAGDNCNEFFNSASCCSRTRISRALRARANKPGASSNN